MLVYCQVHTCCVGFLKPVDVFSSILTHEKHIFITHSYYWWCMISSENLTVLIKMDVIREIINIHNIVINSFNLLIHSS